MGDVAARLAHVFRTDADALAGKPIIDATVTAAGMAEANGAMLDGHGERSPQVLADRIGALGCGAPGCCRRRWRVILLEECLIHGRAIARATGRPWPIEGAVLPLVAALPPTALVDQGRARSFQARFDVRLRGGGRTAMVFDRGSLTLEPGGTRRADAYPSADPGALMLVFIGRQGIAKPAVTGKLLAWGPRPWKLARMLTVISPP